MLHLFAEHMRLVVEGVATILSQLLPHRTFSRSSSLRVPFLRWERAYPDAHIGQASDSAPPSRQHPASPDPDTNRVHESSTYAGLRGSRAWVHMRSSSTCQPRCGWNRAVRPG